MLSPTPLGHAIMFVANVAWLTLQLVVILYLLVCAVDFLSRSKGGE